METLKKREEEIIQDWVEMAPNKRREVSVRIERRRVLFHCVGFKCFFTVCVFERLQRLATLQLEAFLGSELGTVRDERRRCEGAST